MHLREVKDGRAFTVRAEMSPVIHEDRSRELKSLHANKARKTSSDNYLSQPPRSGLVQLGFGLPICNLSLCNQHQGAV
jgi:hypothetical protein